MRRSFGLTSDAVRDHMVQRLSGFISNPQVLAAMRAVPRHLFIEPALQSLAYEDTALPIGFEQTISKPSVVARMVELLLNGRPHFSGKVLEIGAGCGYQAAILGQLARHTWSMERIEDLAHKATANILALNLQSRVRIRTGDGMRGFADVAPYCAIISAAGGESIPAAWIDQLAVGGRLVAPTCIPNPSTSASAGTGAEPLQALQVVDKLPSGLVQTTLDAVHFVPLKSGTQYGSTGSRPA